MKKTYRDALHYFPKTIFSSIFIEMFQVATTIICASVIGSFSNAVFNQETAYVIDNLWYLLACISINVIAVPLLCYWGDTICIKDSIRYDIFMFSQFLRLPYEEGSKIPVGEVKARLESDVIAFRNLMIGIITKAVTTPLSLIGIIVLMVRINLLYTVITIVLSLVVLIVPHFTKKLSAKYDDETRRYEAQESARSYDLIILSPFIKLYRLGGQLLSDYRNSFAVYREKTQKKSILLKSLCENISALLAAFSNILILILGAYFLSENIVSAGEILAMAGYYTALLSSMGNVGFIISRTAILKNVETRVAVFYSNENTANGIPSDNLLPLSANQVSYSIDGKCILNPVSFQIRPNQKVAIIGKNGTGKSTLLNIITGLYRSYDGTVISGTTELKEYPLPVLAEKYSFVSQSPFVFNGTVRENIEFGCDVVDEQKAEDIMKSVGIFDMRDRVINTKANNLSGGELQRISLARALLRDRTVIIMDEPNNHLDHACVAWIKEYIRTSKKSILYVTHDQELTNLADMVNCI